MPVFKKWKVSIVRVSSGIIISNLNFSLTFCVCCFQLSAAGARCDYGLYVGASADNYSTVKDLAHLAAGLKMYLNETFTTLRLDEMSTWMKVRTLVFCW